MNNAGNVWPDAAQLVQDGVIRGSSKTDIECVGEVDALVAWVGERAAVPRG